MMIEPVNIYRRPFEGVAAGDAIPFFHDGIYHLFHLSSPPNTKHYPERVRCSWRHVISEDLKSWRELPVALEPSDETGAPDANGVWTGSVIFADGLYHIFYTGYLMDSAFPQTICHATSKDGVIFEKVPNNPILISDNKRYEPVDWRDPFVFYNEQEKQYWMLIAARLKEGPPNFRGCIVLATSLDLFCWKLEDPIYSPNTTYCPECPELFQMGQKWYLVYSRFSETAQTIYRIADNPRGPWVTPRLDSLDGRRWYAAKSLGDGKRRIAFGWVHERDGNTDDGTWEWGGDFCVPRELYPLKNNEIGVMCPQEVSSLFDTHHPIEFKPILGTWETNASTIVGKAGDKLAYGFITAPSTFYQFHCSLKPQDLQGNFGILLKASSDLSSCHFIAFKPGNQCVAILRWPEPLDAFWRDLTDRKVPMPDPDGPHLVERPLSIEVGTNVDCTILVEDSIVEVFIDNKLSLSHRMYNQGEYELGLIVQSGQVAFESLTLKTPLTY